MNRRLSAILSDMNPPKIMVVGDVILDVYIKGSVDRISPESPAQVLDVSERESLLGGAANVAAGVVALGGVAILCGIVGKDDAADQVRKLLEKRKLSTTGLLIDQTRPTTRKTRFMALRQQMLRVDEERRDDIPDVLQKRMLKKIAKTMPRCDGVIISDYGKGALPASLLAEIFRLAADSGKKVIVDPKGTDYSRYRGATLITPNKKEAAAASGIDINTEADYVRAARKLIKVTAAKDALITRGEEGMSLFNGNGGRKSLHLPAEALEVFDVSGAGDTVTAAIGVTLYSGADLADAARIANVAAAIGVTHVGARAVTKEEVLDKLKPTSRPDGKCVTRTEAGKLAKKLQTEGKTVVFTNGCFDILHAGHVTYLEQARQQGDALIVGLNSDKSVRSLGKGQGRPINNQVDRATVLAALSAVDAVCIFGENTPLKLITAIQPDVLVKGGDWQPDQVVGSDLVKKRGGRIVIAPLLEGRSTTSVIDLLRGEKKQ